MAINITRHLFTTHPASPNNLRNRHRDARPPPPLRLVNVSRRCSVGYLGFTGLFLALLQVYASTVTVEMKERRKHPVGFSRRASLFFFFFFFFTWKLWLTRCSNLCYTFHMSALPNHKWLGHTWTDRYILYTLTHTHTHTHTHTPPL